MLLHGIAAASWGDDAKQGQGCSGSLSPTSSQKLILAPPSPLPLLLPPARCSHGVLDRALMHCDCVYLFPHLRAQGFVCMTNQASNTAFRGFGGPQVGGSVRGLARGSGSVRYRHSPGSAATLASDPAPAQ